MSVGVSGQARVEIGWPGARKLASVFPTPPPTEPTRTAPAPHWASVSPNDRPLRPLQSDLFGLCDPSKDTRGSWELGLGVAGGQYRMPAQVTLMVIS